MPSIPRNLKATCYVLSTLSCITVLQKPHKQNGQWNSPPQNQRATYSHVCFNSSFSLTAVTSPPGLKPWKAQMFKLCLKAISRLCLPESAFLLFSHPKRSASTDPAAFLGLRALGPVWVLCAWP